ncbi:MAG: hypothetical protein WC337_07845 [Candidatus Muiribacteriota bacterium]
MKLIKLILLAFFSALILTGCGSKEEKKANEVVVKKWQHVET